MVAQVAHIGHIATANAEHHGDGMLTAHLQPFLGQTFAFVNTETRSLSSDSIHQNTLNTFRLQVDAILLNYVPADASPENYVRNFENFENSDNEFVHLFD